MSKPHDAKPATPRRRAESDAPAPLAPPTAPPDRTPGPPLRFVEVKPGLFVNIDQVVSLRVLPKEEDGVVAILQLSNGEKIGVDRSEFTAVSGVEAPTHRTWDPNPRMA